MSAPTMNLMEITKAEAEAADAAVKAAAAAEAARIKAEQARQRAEAERAARMRAYLDKLTAQWPEARSTAAVAVGEARQALEDAVRDGGDVFGTYRRWVDASIALWEVDSELQQMRDFCGQPARETPMPAFNFAVDVAAIIDRLSMELQDDAIDRIRDRRAAFLSGKEG